MVDGGSYPASGGSLTLAGGALTFAGTGSYTGGTIVGGGSFNLTGSLIGDLLVLPAGKLMVASGGSYANPGGVVLNLGATTVNGTMTASVFNAGTLGGTGSIVGNVLNPRHGSARQLDRHAHCHRQLPAGRGRHLPCRVQRLGPKRPGQRRRPGGAAGRRRQRLCPAGNDLRTALDLRLLTAAGGLRHLRFGERALSVPAIEPELRRQRRLSDLEIGGSRPRRRPRRRPRWAMCSTPTSTLRPATSPTC